MNRRILALALAATAVACKEQNRRNPDGSPALSYSAQDSLLKVKDSVIAEKTRQLSEQSSIIGDAATSARLISEIDKDLANVRLKADKKSNVTTVAETEANASSKLETIQSKVRVLLSRLNASEARVRKMRADALAHAKVDSEQVSRLAEYERSIQDMKATVERQQAEIVSLTQRVDSLTSANTVLIARTNEMSAREDSVFVAIGSEKDLMKRGLIKKEGGTKFMFGRGKTIVAARHLEPAQFQTISKLKDLTISLPDPNKTYRIVTRQDMHYAEPQDPKKGMVKGSLKISDPNAFWGGSKYLILVEQ
jgi:myosin heavy subunit